MAEHGLKYSALAGFRRAAKAQKFVTLLLLFILLTAVTASVTTVLTGPDWASLWESLLFGLLVGWLLAIYRWPAWRSALLVVGLGLFYLLIFTAGLGQKIIPIFNEFFKLVSGIILTLSVKGADLSSLNTAVLDLTNSIAIVLGRVFTWINNLVSGQPGFDPVAASMVWSFMVWLVAAWAGWFVEAGRNVVIAVLPALLMCLSTLSYTRKVTGTIYLLLGIFLVLVAVVNYDHREQDWTETKIAYPQHKGRQVGNVSLVIAIVLVVLAAIVSSLSLQKLIHFTSQYRSSTNQGESGLAKSLGIVPAATPTPDTFSNLRSPGLPRELLIGASPLLLQEIVMSVDVTDIGTYPLSGRLPPFYWRSFTYDIYTGHGWSSSVTQQSQYQSGQLIQPAQLPDHVLVQQAINLVPNAAGDLYAAGEPSSADVTTIAAFRSSNDLFGVQTNNNIYEVRSSIPSIDENQLRQAGQDYPGWVADRYLKLPATVPARVKELSIQLTAAEPTPYDRAHAIEQYLRQSFPYTLDVPIPPANQDLVDYFLFDLRKGYCDYYASAMVVLARAAGIPARLAVGFASGTYNLNTQRFLVRQADAHSWVEIYFPGIGWVPFEPTAGLPAINRSAQSSQPATPAPALPIATPPGSPASVISRGKFIGLAVLLAVALTGIIWAVWDAARLSRLDRRGAAVEVYRRLSRYASALGVRFEGGETPYEFSEGMQNRILEISHHAGMPSVGADAASGTNTIIQQIVIISYRPVEDESSRSKGLISSWRSLSWKLRWIWVGKTWESIAHRFQGTLDGEPVGKSA